MAFSPETAAPELEIGPLSWVKGEIDVALAEVRERLDAYANSGDGADLKRAHAALHQVSGALSMVGLAAARRFGEEMEKAVEMLGGISGSALAQPIISIKRGGNALSAYLDTLLAGETDRPMMLLPPYLELNRAQGKTDAGEGDLFFPSLTTPIALPTRDRQAVDDSVRDKALVHQRAQYQQCLLKVMRNLDAAEALKTMHAAVVTVESFQADAAPRAFWNAAVAFLESLVFGGAEINVAAKQLFAKIDQQIKSLIDHNWNLNERLFRDLLLFVGRAKPVTARIAQVRDVYRLERLLSLPDMPRGVDAADGQKEIVRELRDLIAVQKDTWLKYTSGQRGAIDPFTDQGGTLTSKARSQPNADLAQVLSTLGEVGPQLKARQIPPSEAQSLEVATALLFAETALENYFRLGTDFARQAKSVTQRVRAAMAGERLPAIEAGEGLLDQSTRKAQERLLMFQVGHEVLANLSSIEAALDGFFRDNSKRADIAQLGGQFTQVQGALMIMEMKDASDLNLALMKKVQALAGESKAVAHADAELVADGLSALSLFVASVQKGETNPAAVLTSALIKFGLREPVAAKPVEVQMPSDEKHSVDSALADVQAAYGAALDDLTQGEATLITRPSLPEISLAAPASVGETATNRPDLAPTLVSAPVAPAATSAVFDEAAASAPTLRLKTIHEPAAEPPKPLMPAVTLTDKPQEVDDELLGIFLEEAAEVVVTIGDNLAIAREKPYDKESLTVIRRGFHTLKGSGRMVGLMDLGEVAWQCEQVMNKWLAEERHATPSLCNFIETAQLSFAGWVLALQETGSADIDGSSITALAERIKAGDDTVPVGDVVALNVPIVETFASADVPAPIAAEMAMMEALASPVERAYGSELMAEPVAEVGAEAVTESISERAAAPIAEPSAEPEPAFADTAEREPEEEPDLLIGTVAIQPTFLSIYLGEADSHVDTLEREMLALESNPYAPVSHAFMRAAHTLTSTSRTTGFTMVADVAYPLEKWLQDAMEFHPEMNATRLAATRDGVNACAEMVRAIGRLQAPEPHPTVAEALVAIREALATERKTATGVHTKLASITQQLLAISEDETPPPSLREELVMPFAKTLDLKPDSELMAAAADEFRAAESPTPSPESIVIEPAASDAFAATVADFALPAAVVATGAGLVAADAATPPPLLETPLATELPPPLPVEALLEASLEQTPPPLPTAEFESLQSFDDSIPELTDKAPESVTTAPVFAADSLPELDAAMFSEPLPLVSEPVSEPRTVSDPEPLLTDFVATESAVTIEPALEAFAEAAPPLLPEPVPVPPEPPAETPWLAAAGGVAAAGLVGVATSDPTRSLVKSPTETTVTRRPTESTQKLMTLPDTAPMDAPTAPALMEVGKDRRVISDDVDADLLPVFVEEARELLPQAGESLRQWRGKHDNLAAAGELQRHLHTLKGSARMTGLMRLGELAHVIETKVLAMGVAKSLSNAEFDDVQDKLDRFNGSLERVASGQDYQLFDPAEVPVGAELDQADKPAVLATIAAQRDAAAAATAGADASRQALLRVPADAVDRFVNQAGELSIARSRVEGELIAFKRGLVDLNDNVARMRGQLREIEIAAETQIQSSMREKESRGERFDPLEFDRFSRLQELTRFMAESVNDLVTLQLGLQRNIDESDAALLQQMRLNRDLQQGLMGVRLVPLTNLSDRFYRVVRQTAKELGKKANLELRGVRVELDRSVLEKITAPFEHLLRNAISHGIEMPEERAKLNKAEIGEITIDAAQIGNEVVLTVADDGSGLNFARIREKAIDAGLLDPTADVGEAQLAQYIFMPGFSTASEITQISGRGVGMDVVRNDITALGGRIEIGSVAGRGTTFTITLPLTLAVTQAVLLRAGGTVYAVPSVMVEQAQEYKANGYADVLAKGEIRFKDNRYPLRSLLPLLGQIDTPTPQRNIPVLLLRSGAQRAAVRVDEIIGNREVVVKTIGPQLARLAGIAGATVMGNGQVVLILNPVQLVHREVAVVTSREQAPIAAPADLEPSLVISESSGMPLVMVVDDSLTVRKITSRMLTREGFEVVTAKDGVDALQQLQDTRPDLILSDIEMPRMDGFELLRNIRADEGLRGIPIIMITSRTADKHRAHAIELGVNEYLGKPYQEDQLLALIRQYTGEGVRYAAAR